MFFAKGEIIMNNIYKVIWSKAKNCYVVASEIARSHTKSATGSEKIGGVTRRSLLASLMALSLLCGGLGVASAAEEVSVEPSTSGSAVAVYTKEGTQSYVQSKLDNYDTKTQVDDKINTKIEALTTTGDVATNKDNIGKLQTKTANLDGAELTGMTTVSGATVSGTNVEAGELKVTGQIIDGKGVTTTLADINDSMKQTKTNKEDIANLKTTTGDQDTAIKDLQKKTTNISYVDGVGTSIDGITVKDGNIVGNGNSAITQLANVETDRIETDSINGKSLTGTNVATEKNVKDVADAVKAETDARTEADTALEGKINDEKTARENKDNELEGKITKNTQDIAKLDENGVKYDTAVKDTITLKGPDSTKITNLKDADLSDSSTDAVTGKQLNKTNEDLKTEAQTRKDMDTLLSNRADALEKNTGGITRNDAKDETYIEKNVTVDNQGNITAKGKVTANGGVDAGAVNAGSLNVTDASHLKGDVTMDNNLTVKGDTSLKKTDVDGALTVTGESSLKNTTVGGTLVVTGETKLKDKLTAKGEATFEKNVTAEKDLTVNGKLNVGEISMKNDELDINGDQHDSTTTITADGISNNAKVTDRNGVTTESKFTHDKEGSTTYARKGDATDWKEATSNVTADGVENIAKDSKGNNNTFTQTSTDTKNTLTDKEGNTSSTRQDSKGVYGYAKDKDGNKSYTKQEGNRIAESVIGQDGKETKSEMTSTDITNTAKDGTIKNDAKDIVNNATGDMTNNVGGNLSTTVGGNEIHEVKGTKTETVEGKVTENFKNGQETNVTGNQDIHVTGKQTNTVKGGQENIISGGQTNTITGGQINNITGDQTTTITGNKTETVTENVTEDYKKNLTTTVGGNEIHEVKGTKTETVEGKLIENFKGGQETNVTGDQTTNVSGTQTTTATDINRNASSGMIDTIDNDYGTNTETKVAGKTTTDVSIKGTGEKGQYIRGANESRDYLIKGTLKNSETKTAEATSTEITDGTNKASTIQDAKNLAGSVTNGTETGVSGIHANNDGSVSIDSSVAGGGMSSVINQKKDSIQSAVGDGTNSTVIHQDKDNVTIASSNGMVGLVGKDIVNNAQNTITNTAGTKITDTAGDSTVTTENGKGTTFTKTGSTAYREGGPTDTNISGNTITTGKVTMDYADVMKDLGVRGNANITGKTTTGSLEVTGTSTLTGDVTMESNAKVKKDLTVEGTTTTKTLKVTENAEIDGTLKVAKKATFEDSVSIAKDLSVGGDVTAKSYKVGDKTYISAAGINANDQKITNVADGSISEGSKDAVNGGQLYGVKNDLEGKVNKVGANAAAMANLHPMEFDPDSKWNIAAAIGNYGSETAAALGAFYRPNDDVMVNLSTAFGTGENMVGGGVSVRLGQGGNKLSREDSNQLKAQVADLTARMDALLSVLNPNMSKDFPDVPENHWAYEAVSRLAGNDIVQGYPDGEFHGERTMTRYEMAEIIYNALSRGAEAEKELVEEFKPELQAMAASEKATAEKAEG